MTYMPETRKDEPRLLHKREASSPDVTATVDVTDLLARLADRTEELAEAKVRQEHTEADLKRKTREMASERKAHTEARQQLEADCQQLEAECHEVAAECRKLEAEIARQREARAAVEADLKRAEDRAAELQHQLQIVWAQLREDKRAGQRPRWRKSDS
jgi:chromosome segregation ATPase